MQTCRQQHSAGPGQQLCIHAIHLWLVVLLGLGQVAHHRHQLLLHTTSTRCCQCRVQWPLLLLVLLLLPCHRPQWDSKPAAAGCVLPEHACKLSSCCSPCCQVCHSCWWGCCCWGCCCWGYLQGGTIHATSSLHELDNQRCMPWQSSKQATFVCAPCTCSSMLQREEKGWRRLWDTGGGALGRVAARAVAPTLVTTDIVYATHQEDGGLLDAAPAMRQVLGLPLLA